MGASSTKITKLLSQLLRALANREDDHEENNNYVKEILESILGNFLIDSGVAKSII